MRKNILNVKFLDLSLPTEQIKDEYLKRVAGLLDKGNFILTEEVEEFEKSWAEIIGAKYAIGASNGADALYMALLAVGAGQGDEVITQGNAYNASVTAILRTGAIPRFADIDRKSMRIDVPKIEPLINKKTKVIMPVHLFGQANDMRSICEIAKKYNLKVVEDCAQSHLAKYLHKYTGNWGDAGAFSFYPTKNLGAFGDAGAITTNNESIKNKVIALRNLGQTGKNNHQYIGFNMRLDPIQASCLSLKLKYLPQNTALREEAGKYYDKLIQKSGLKIHPVLRDENGNHVYHLYVVRVKEGERQKLQEYLFQNGIQTAVHYPVPVYCQPFYMNGKISGKTEDKCPATDETAKEIISLPMYYGISKKDQEYVVEVISNWVIK